jgi:regulator of nucleoside diphosphate kinase
MKTPHLQNASPAVRKAGLPRNRLHITRLDHGRLLTLVAQERHRHGNEPVAALSQELARAELVDASGILPDIITMNSRVKLRDMHSPAELILTLVYPQCATAQTNVISVLGPLGTALLGCRLGDQIGWPVAGGRATYWVEAILHQPEAAGDWLS